MTGHYLLLPPRTNKTDENLDTPEMKTARGPLMKGCLPATIGDLLHPLRPPGPKPSEAAMSFGTLCTCTLDFPARTRRGEAEGLSRRFEGHRSVPNKHGVTSQPWKSPHATRSTVRGMDLRLTVWERHWTKYTRTRSDCWEGK